MELSRRVVVVVLWLGLVSAPLSAETVDCSNPPDCLLLASTLREYGSHQYAISFRLATWSEARERCHKCGYHLAQIGSQAELDFIKNWLTTTGIYDPKSSEFGPFQIWVDGSDEGHSKCWVWTYPKVTQWTLEDGFHFWAPKEPNSISRKEHRVSLFWQKNLDGNDIKGYEHHPFICERDPSVPLGDLPSLDEVSTAPCP